MESKFISNILLKELLDKASMHEKDELSKILFNKKNKFISSEEIVSKISKLGSNNIFWDWYREEGTSYLDILIDLSEELEIKNSPNYDLEVKCFDYKDSWLFEEDNALEKNIAQTNNLEKLIQIKLLENIYSKFSDTQKDEFDEKLNQFLNNDMKSLKYVSGLAGISLIGNLGGFATYTFLSSALSTLSFGTLGFGAYVSASYFISILLGPIGLSLLGIAAISSLTGPSKEDYKKLLEVILLIPSIKYRVKFDEILSDINNDLESLELASFDKIYRYCKNVLLDGNADINIKYIIDYGKMHKAIMYNFLNKNLNVFKNMKKISIIDWGCDQGINTLVFLDYMREKQIDIKVDSIYLIEEDVTKLKLAKIFLRSFSNMMDTRIITINKSLHKLKDSDFKLEDVMPFNIFTNCRYLESISIEDLPLIAGYYLNIQSNTCSIFEEIFNQYSSIFKDELSLVNLDENCKIGKYNYNSILFELI